MEFDGTILDGLASSDIALQQSRSSGNVLSVRVLLDPDRTTDVPSGDGLPLFRFAALVEGGAAGAEVQLLHDANNAGELSIVLVDTGSFVPRLRGLTMGESSGPGSSAGGPFVHPSDLVVEEYSTTGNPSEFAPTSGDSESAPQAITLGGLGPSSPGWLSDRCIYDTSLGDPFTVLAGVPTVVVGPGGLIQQALGVYTPGGGDFAVRVGPQLGVPLMENVVIDMATIAVGETIYLYSELGPDDVIIDGMGVGPAIEIVDGNGLAGNGNLVIGWSNVIDDSPTPPAAGNHVDWFGFQLTNSGDSPGILHIDGAVGGQIEIRGNILTDNDPLVGFGPPEGGGVFIDVSDDVLMILNEVFDNVVRAIGGGDSGRRLAGHPPGADRPRRDAELCEFLGRGC